MLYLDESRFLAVSPPARISRCLIRFAHCRAHNKIIAVLEINSFAAAAPLSFPIGSDCLAAAFLRLHGSPHASSAVLPHFTCSKPSTVIC